MSDTRLISARDMEMFARVLVETCVRNTQIENLHAGITPTSLAGDFSDVKVVTPLGDIPCTRLSRISDVEMKALMIEIVDRVYTFVRCPEDLAAPSVTAARWNRPKLDPRLMRTVRRRRASRRQRPSPPKRQGV